jgi:hypothetical protein
MDLDLIFWLVMLTEITVLTTVFTTSATVRFGFRLQSLLLLGAVGIPLAFAAGNFRVNGFDVGWVMSRVHTGAFYWLLMAWMALLVKRRPKTTRVDAKPE